jgi:hypothetical protein
LIASLDRSSINEIDLHHLLAMDWVVLLVTQRRNYLSTLGVDYFAGIIRPLSQGSLEMPARSGQNKLKTANQSEHGLAPDIA